ncbi:retropepsin-like domain-containing protein [Patescibacteria group bacterium]|nr:retropepsin-like domain-containing protein [Patescibacteria group bacterium]MBU4481666.1 retropepsin-like domain-containing protein [Patescibacteria group bacterium]
MRKEFSYFEKDSQYFPIIEVKLKGSKNELTVRALIDSGASFSVFRPEVAQDLGIALEKGKMIYLTGIGGRILGYLHELPVILLDKTFRCKIVFSPEFNVSFNLLGRDNFFLPFIISFLEKNKKIIIQENKKQLSVI